VKYSKQIVASVGIAALVISLISITLWYFSDRVSTLSHKISTGLDIIPSCGYAVNVTKNIQETLLNAEKKLHIESNYDSARDLYNSVSSQLIGCDPKLQVPEPYFMLLTVFIMAIVLLALYGFTKRFAS